MHHMLHVLLTQSVHFQLLTSDQITQEHAFHSHY